MEISNGEINDVLNDRKNTVDNLNRIKTRVLKSWESRVRIFVPCAREKSKSILQNMVPELLDNLVANLSPQVSEIDFQRAGEIGNEHGNQRSSLYDYTIVQVLDEYRILRETIFEVLEEEQIQGPLIRNTILNVIDEGIQKAVARFTFCRSKQLEQSNKDLEHFAAVAAHDLKSPLATISGLIELLNINLGVQIGPTDKKCFDAIHRSTSNMMMLIDRTLEYSGIDLKNAFFVEVSINQVITQVLESLQDLISKSNARVTFPALPKVVGDHQLLAQLFQNLITNAIKFQKSGVSPEIHISALEEPTRWYFSVKDNGIGINTEDKESLFTIFKTLPRNNERHGNGIGLATVRKIVELHGGTISFESLKEGGTNFYFYIEKIP